MEYLKLKIDIVSLLYFKWIYYYYFLNLILNIHIGIELFKKIYVLWNQSVNNIKMT